MTKAIQLLIKYKSDLGWMISDQAAEFDEYLLMPIRDRARFADAIIGFYQFYWSKRPGTTRLDETNRLGDVLTNLANEGEDMDRLSRWLLSLKDTDKTNGQNIDVISNWYSGFRYWYENGLPAETNKRLPLASDIVNSFYQEVIVPCVQFMEMTDASEKRWLASSENRSVHDNYLFEKRFGESENSPSTWFSSYHDSTIMVS